MGGERTWPRFPYATKDNSSVSHLSASQVLASVLYAEMLTAGTSKESEHAARIHEDLLSLLPSALNPISQAKAEEFFASSGVEAVCSSLRRFPDKTTVQARTSREGVCS